MKVDKPVKVEQLPGRVRRIVEQCRASERLCVAHKYKASGETETFYFLELSGGPIGPATARAAIETPFLKPLGDSLFDPSLSQTYRFAAKALTPA